jgi:transcriptional regulator with XRE-family HTH domain
VKFSEFIRSKRKDKALTQEAVAKQSGISSRYLSSIECERSAPPTTPVVRRLAQTLEIDETALLDIANASRPPERDRTCSDETRLKMSLAHMNYVFTEEHRRKLKEARQGKKDPEPTRAKKAAILVQARATYAQMREEGWA